MTLSIHDTKINTYTVLKFNFLKGENGFWNLELDEKKRYEQNGNYIQKNHDEVTGFKTLKKYSPLAIFKDSVSTAQ